MEKKKFFLFRFLALKKHHKSSNKLRKEMTHTHFSQRIMIKFAQLTMKLNESHGALCVCV